MRTLVGMLLLGALLGAGTALANGVVHFKNEGNRAIELFSYDWDDPFRNQQYDHRKVPPGEVGYVECRKSWVDKNAPGCWVYIRDWDAFHPLWNPATRFCNASEDNPYIFQGHWEYPDEMSWTGLGSIKIRDPDPEPHC